LQKKRKKKVIVHTGVDIEAAEQEAVLEADVGFLVLAQLGGSIGSRR
jgi:hypothetical protein